MNWRPSRMDLPGLLVPLGLIVLWQLLSLHLASPLFPGPMKVAFAIVNNFNVIVKEIGHTLLRAAFGFALAAVLMIPLGVVLGRIPVIGRLLEPIMDMLATLPPPAIIPLVMLFAGTGDWAKIVIIAYAAGVPMLNRVAKSLQLSRLETMLYIDLPSSWPMIATGARLAIASSLLGSVTSEMLLATNGIGVYLQRSQEYFRIDAGIAGLFFISLAGLLINAAMAKLERRWLFWHYRETSAD